MEASTIDKTSAREARIFPGVPDGLKDRISPFAMFQLIGWGALTVINYLSLTLWYNPLQIEYFAAPFIQSIAGMVLSVPLKQIAERTWTRSLAVRIVTNGLGVIVIGIVWTISRIAIFEGVTGDAIAVAEYGGWLHASIIVFGAWVLSFHAVKYFYSVQRQKELRHEAEARASTERARRLEAEGLSRDAQMMMLRYQINPHFLFNALNSINALIRLRRNEDARKMLMKMSDFMRLSLASDLTAEIPFSDELTNTKLYLDVEKTRFASRVKLEFDVDDDALCANVPSMILQPIYENAFKHAVGVTSENVTIRLTACLRNNNLVISICDSCPSRIDFITADVMEKIQQSKGVGLNNVRDRLRALHGKRAWLSFERNLDCGLAVSITMPFNQAIGSTGALGEN